MIAKGEGFGGGLDWEVGISRCKLLYIGRIHTKVLSYSAGNDSQYPVINHNGKEKGGKKTTRGVTQRCRWFGRLETISESHTYI